MFINNNYYFKIISEPPVILKEPNRTLVEEQGNTELSCEVSGNPIPIVSWTLNGEPVQNDSHTTTLGMTLFFFIYIFFYLFRRIDKVQYLYIIKLFKLIL